MFAAELLEKNAVTPLSLRHVKTNGKGFLFKSRAEISGLIMNAMIRMHPTINNMSSPYCEKILKPLSQTDVNTKPITPIGAN